MLEVGDLLVVRSAGWANRLVRLAAALRDRPNLDNHVAVLHHRDEAGVWWAVEGRPGGVGWQDARHYLADPYTCNNALQPKTAKQRKQVAEIVVGMLGTPYDWGGIIADAMDAIHVKDFWLQDWHGQGPPGHVVCSSLAAYAYQRVGLPIPTDDEPRMVTPADWEQFIVTRRYAEAEPAIAG